mmetsp:Transcript_14134/g.32815  ORF Transcript_14134/g.32815 Transcript_14134/m.32815 type:complete len:526 (+) Transcript_14134:403-1980(+)
MSPGRPSNTFALRPPASSPEGSTDSGLLDDNDLTVGLLANENDGDDDDDDDDNVPSDDNPDQNNVDDLDDDDVEDMNSDDQRHSKIRLIMRRIGPHIASATLMTMLLLVPLVIYRALSDKKVEMAAFHSAGVMVIGTLIMSIRLIYLHFTHWYMPGVQKYVIRIILMVPIYAVQSWLSLRFHHARIYIDAIRNLYEAFVISSFVYYLIELLGGEEALVRTLRQKVRDDPALAHHLGQHTFPLSLVLEPWELGVEFMLQCKHGALQYVVAKTGFTILTYIFQSLGMYGEGNFNWTSPYPYLAFLMNISVMYALYSLVKLFHAVQDELRYPINWHPLGKFLCIKGVVFFTWWQGVLIFYLKAHGVIDDVGSWTGDEVANGLIDYCICVEMVMFAIAHSFTFTYTEYLPSTVENAIEGYEQVQQQLLPRENIEENSHNNSDDREASFSNSQGTSYNPPEMLARPARFKDAFWSSTVPSETLHDIRRLQNGVNHAASQVINPGIIHLQGLANSPTSGNDDEPDLQQHDV